MAEWFREYWTYALGFVGVCIFAFFIFRAAAKAYSAHKKSYKAEEAYITRLKALKEKYVPLTKKTIENAPDGELLEGAALGIQIFLQKQEDMEAEFLLPIRLLTAFLETTRKYSKAALFRRFRLSDLRRRRSALRLLQKCLTIRTRKPRSTKKSSQSWTKSLKMRAF